jgi:hypothetical protein
MRSRSLSAAAATALLVLAPPAHPQSAPERAIRRDIPMTNAIRRAFAAGTRDSTGRPGARYWQLRADYTIAARLDTATSRIEGRATIAIHNASPDSLRQLVLRLDPNLFRGTTPHASPWVPAEITDGMVITRMALDGRAVNLAPAPQQEPSRVTEPTAFGLTQTVARVALPAAIQAGARVNLEIDWSFKVPGGPGQGHRMTMRWGDTLYQPTQWFPRLAVYDDLRGWDTELYLGPSEFYNNFGRFDVRLDVPAGWIVSGTGLLQNAEQVLTGRARERLARALEGDGNTTIVGADELGPGRATQPGSGGRLVWHFVADSVNDFAWATSRSYTWHMTRATIGGRRVPIHMVHLPGRARFYANAGPITRHALEFYSRLWFDYPFPQLTLQDGPSAGMEYPMVINSNQGAADHETGHQWWPMVVSNNETWYGWMDEGFDQYMNILSHADAAGRAPVLDGLGQSYGRIAGTEAEPPMMWNANYGGPDMYFFTTYSKTPLMLSMLGGIVGDSAVQRAHAEWGRAWMFRHPSPWDWMFFMQRALGMDLGWFWYSWLFTTETVDGAITGVTTRGGRTAVTVRQAGQMPSPVVLRVTLAARGPRVRPPAGAVMTDSVTAVVTYPVDVWFGGSRSFTATLDFGGRAVERVVLDPGCRFPDRDASDNVWPRDAGPACRAAGR